LAYIEYPINIKPCIVPNDAEYVRQWHLKSSYNPNADIDAEQAWEINTGRNDVIIAVCDGGVDYMHPDLDHGDRSRIIMGYDSGNDDNDPMDDLPDVAGSYGGHGTHIAGIIGAITNNDTLVSGVMWYTN
jgi:subtilisin family serine protease